MARRIRGRLCLGHASKGTSSVQQGPDDSLPPLASVAHQSKRELHGTYAARLAPYRELMRMGCSKNACSSSRADHLMLKETTKALQSNPACRQDTITPKTSTTRSPWTDMHQSAPHGSRLSGTGTVRRTRPSSIRGRIRPTRTKMVLLFGQAICQAE
ncbi:hypothetical protein LZ31DRAFT_375150 [Colletotrichum somersetense]|nr:hypothetical protein LZ31DRAFT_375150 [Colletotrichum somersetense]